MALCEHWLRLTLASGSYFLERRLGRLGYAPVGLPDLKSYFFDVQHRWFEQETAIGRVVDDGVVWELGEPADPLSPAVLEAAERVRTTGRCECPHCRELDLDTVPRAELAGSGAKVIAVWSCGGYRMPWIARHPDGGMRAFIGDVQPTWIVGTDLAGGAWRTIHVTDGEEMKAVAFDAAAGTLSAFFQSRGRCTSTDFGATWEPAPATGLPEGVRFFQDPLAGLELGAAARNRMFRSLDAGVTWTEAARLPDKWQVESVKWIDDQHLVALAGHRELERLLWSADGGQTWTEADTPRGLYIQGIVVGATPNVLGICGSFQGAQPPPGKGVMALRSEDYGATWTVIVPCRGFDGDDTALASDGRGRWWFAHSDEQRLSLSTDDGRTFGPVAGPFCQTLFVDGAEVFGMRRSTLVRLA